MTTSTSQFLPTDTGHGTAVGSSYLRRFVMCPRQWFNEYFYPLYDDAGQLAGRGLQPRTRALALTAGSILHEGLAAWYLSGCRDGADTGERDIEHAIDTMSMIAQSERDREHLTPEEYEENLTSSRVILRDYHDSYGPGSRSPDWPDIQVAHDLQGVPIVEREFRIQLTHQYIFTCRSDMLIYHRGYLKTMEHKSSAPGFWAKKRLQNINYDSQFTGEIAVMRAHLATLVPEGTPLHGVLVNVLIKGRGKSNPNVAERDSTTRTDAQLERWRQQTLNTLQRIEDAIGAFEKLVAEGMDINTAADHCFPTLGTVTDQCKAYNRNCDYYELCQLPGMESRLMGKYRPRTTEENTTLRERPY